ncbi:cathepsin like thiol protease [Cryptosporidium ubiquitum]|uniref:Cathepsin like thiol protease n=1 Tax=Cryptosporidium ubiquitum TaxID=857276 RepID=A0A1J4MMC6_9CRYT|nr:cathepsin like thiol protease [Cryptosporidium ubiquitum]OII74156.1 cathepsin like thiol protease [Cryptosporidium ubiquitum]
MQTAFQRGSLAISNKSCGWKRTAIIFVNVITFLSVITTINCNLLHNGNSSLDNNELGANHALSQKNSSSMAKVESNAKDIDHHFVESYSSKKNSTKLLNQDLKSELKKGFQNITNTVEGNNLTSKFFNSVEFNFSINVHKCITEHTELKKYLQKISLIFYFSNKTHKLENEGLNYSSNNTWKIKNDRVSNSTIKMNIATNSGEINNDLDIIIHPEIFINSVHTTNATWTDRLLDISNINSTPLNLLNITNNNQGGESIINCICIFVSEIQSNLGLNKSSLEVCNGKIQEIITAIKLNPEAKFELTQLSLDRPPSKLVIPNNLKNKVIGTSWKESIAEGKELLSKHLLSRTEQGLEVTYNSGNEILRQLNAENPNTDDGKNEPSYETINGNSYFDSRDINGNSCVYIPYDQGNCGGCYAFVVSASVSISNCIQKLELPAPLSPQQIIDCSMSFGNLGCDGGFYSNGWSYLLEQNVPKNYICSWDEYPYIDSLGSCKAGNCNGCLNISKYSVFTDLALNGDDGWDFVTTILPKVGSISLSVNSDLPGFSSYSDGIYKATKCTTFSELNHAVIMVGFGISDDGEKYYVIQNSWGASWGIAGFMNVSANSCDMFWYPGIILQRSSETLPDECKGNKLLLTGPGEINKAQKVSKAYNIFTKESYYVVQLFIFALLLMYL